MSKFIEGLIKENVNQDGVDRRGFLECHGLGRHGDPVRAAGWSSEVVRLE